MVEANSKWSETDSRTFVDIADAAVAGRQEAIDMLVSLVPAEADEPFRLVDIGCGAGALLESVLERHGSAEVTGVDASGLMRAEAKKRLARFGDRARLVAGDIHDAGWLGLIDWPVRCVASSLAIHHIEGPAKRALFRELAARLEPGGALLICDVVEAANDWVQAAFARQWHSIARAQSVSLTGSPATYDRAVAEGWAPTESLQPQPGETPSRLSDQLGWLVDAGLSQVDCFWMRAGVAIYGGYK